MSFRDFIRSQKRPDDRDEDAGHDQDASPGHDNSGDSVRENDNAADSVDKPTTDPTGSIWGPFTELQKERRSGKAEIMGKASDQQEKGQYQEKCFSTQTAGSRLEVKKSPKEIEINLHLETH
jgi:hypothetical protein